MRYNHNINEYNNNNNNDNNNDDDDDDDNDDDDNSIGELFQATGLYKRELFKDKCRCLV